MATSTEKWFGDHFIELHPELQKLHSQGGVLVGEVEVSYGKGVASLIGKRLGKKLGLPSQAGPTSLRVEISHIENTMIWSRKFGDAPKPMISIFTPHGSYQTGHWTESTGAFSVDLTVEVLNAEWHWIQRETRLMNWPIPALLLPALIAKKAVSNNRYHFEVTLFKRGLGVLVQYKGALELDAS